MEITIPNELKAEYPFHSHFLKLSDGNQLHYVDEGQGEVIIMLHGNPTWSFFYRNLIKSFSKNYRVIVPDHMGCGLSSRPEDYTYTLDQHIKNAESLIAHLGIEKFSLIVHDWGGAIGMGLATNNPTRVQKIIAMNTACFTSDEIPARINILRNKIGEMFIRTFNGFAGPAVFMAVKKPMNDIVKKGFLFPYNNYQNRIATAKFVLDIPMTKDHGTYPRLFAIENKLKEIKAPVLLLWGAKDFCFTLNFMKRWQEFFPTAKSKVYPEAGHYLIEDECDDVLKEMTSFLKN